MTLRKMFDLTRDSEIEAVEIAHSNACDNAAQAVGFANRFDADGKFSDAFVAEWEASIQSFLCDQRPSNAAVAFFNAINFAY